MVYDSFRMPFGLILHKSRLSVLELNRMMSFSLVLREYTDPVRMTTTISTLSGRLRELYFRSWERYLQHDLYHIWWHFQKYLWPTATPFWGGFIIALVWTSSDQSRPRAQSSAKAAENFANRPTSKRTSWSVSQAAPLRRVHVVGDLAFGTYNGALTAGAAKGAEQEHRRAKLAVLDSLKDL